MFASIRRYQRILWLIVAIVVVISFVFVDFMTNRGGGRGGGSELDLGTVYGKQITREEYLKAMQEMKLFHYLRYQEWPGSDRSRQMGFDLERETYNRLVLIEKINRMKIVVSPESRSEWAREVFKGPENQPFTAEMYDSFVANTLNKNGLSAEDFWRFAAHQVAQQHIMTVLGTSGKLVTPQEGETLFKQSNEQIQSDLVMFPSSNYLAKVTIIPQALGEFFTNNMPDYRLPTQVQVSYVLFDTSNFLAQATAELAALTNLNAALDAAYQRQGPDFYKDAAGQPLSAEAAKAKIKAEQILLTARIQAEKKANDFIKELIDLHDKDPKQKDLLERLASANGLLAKTTAPFSEEMPPAGIQSPNFSQAAFALNSEDPLSTIPLMSEEGAYVIGLKNTIPTRDQTMEAVRERVVQDFKTVESVRLAKSAGDQFLISLTNGLAAGKTFSEIAAESRVVVTPLPPFSLSSKTVPGWDYAINLNMMQRIAQSLTPGKHSMYIPMREGGMVLFLRGRQPVDVSKVAAELPGFLNELRSERMGAAFSDWYQRECQEQLKIPAANTVRK